MRNEASSRNLPPPLPRRINSEAGRSALAGQPSSQTERRGKIAHNSGEFPVARRDYAHDEEGEASVYEPDGSTSSISKNSDEYRNADWLGSHELEDIQDRPPEIPKSIREQSILDAANRKFRQRANLNPYTRHTEAIKQSMLGGVFSQEMYAKAHDKVMAPIYKAMDENPENVSPFIEKQINISLAAHSSPETLIEERMKGLKIDSRDPRLKELLPAIRAEMETLEKAYEAIKKARKRDEEINQELDRKAELRRSIRKTGSRESSLDEADSDNLVDLMMSASHPTRSKRNPEVKTEKQKDNLLNELKGTPLSKTEYRMQGEPVAEEQRKKPFREAMRTHRALLKEIADKLAYQGVIVDLPWQVAEFKIPAETAGSKISGFLLGKPKADSARDLMNRYRVSAQKWMEANQALKEL